MKQAAKVPCQVRLETGKIITLHIGDVIEYEGEHIHLRPISSSNAPEGTEPINFKTAGEAELFEADFDTEDLKTFIKETYNTTIRVRTKSRLIEKLLDCRYRATNPADFERVG